jgi:hypothetical protein
MSTDTNSVQSCKGWQCLTRVPDNPEQAGWREGYCPECLDELARDEIRAERQEARNEVERPTPITDQLKRDLEDSPLNIESACEHLLDSHAAIERQLADAREEIEILRNLWRASSVCRQFAEQVDMLAEACKKLMAVIGPPDAPIDQCWADVNEINEAWEAGESALATLNRKDGE